MTIAIEVALKAEAHPLIEAFHLKPLSGTTLFSIYEAEGIKLIISGVGKIKAGAACSYLAGIYRDEGLYGWINIGIGGHCTLPIGTPLLVNKIIDEARKVQFFPSFAFDPPCQTEGCMTIENPEHVYPSHNIYDMEAAGFYSIASKISPLELIHVFKVISDNANHPATEVTKKGVHQLIANQIELIKVIIKEIQNLIREIAPITTPFLDEFLKKWHFTTCETHQLKKLLQKWQLICPDQVLFSQDLLSKTESREVLDFLQMHLETTPLKL